VAAAKLARAEVNRSRPDYIQRKIDLELARLRHMREAKPDCGCPWCLPPGAVTEIVRQRNEAERAARPGVPF
jgi:hypothetical protein